MTEFRPENWELLPHAKSIGSDRVNGSECRFPYYESLGPSPGRIGAIMLDFVPLGHVTPNLRYLGKSPKCGAGSRRWPSVPLETNIWNVLLQLLDGRRPCGGRLEVKIRIREPLTSKQVELVREKWLIIDQFNRASGSSVSSLDFSRGWAAVQQTKTNNRFLQPYAWKYTYTLVDERIKTI